MANSKDDILNMLKLSIASGGRLSKHIQELRTEIGEKQSRIYDLQYEVSELKTEKEELIEKCKECIQKDSAVARAEFQKEFLENYNPRKIDN